MEQIIYKYNVGDTIKFKSKFPPSASVGLHKLAGTAGKIVGKKYFAKPFYEIEGHDALVPENAIASIVN